MANSEGDIRINAACLAAYNNGVLHGAWIDATLDPFEIQAEIKKMLEASPIEAAEEWAIQDFEGFEGADVSEYEGVESVIQKARFVLEYGRLGGELIAHYCGDVDAAQSAMDDHYWGQYASLEDFAEELTAETIDIPETLKFYIDYEKMARNLVANDVFAIEPALGVVHVFWYH